MRRRRRRCRHRQVMQMALAMVYPAPAIPTLTTLLALPARPKPLPSLSHFALMRALFPTFCPSEPNLDCISTHVSTTAQMLRPANAGLLQPRIQGGQDRPTPLIWPASLARRHPLPSCLCQSERSPILVKLKMAVATAADSTFLARPPSSGILQTRPQRATNAEDLGPRDSFGSPCGLPSPHPIPPLLSKRFFLVNIRTSVHVHTGTIVCAQRR
ncbi:uncharacterized protein LY79DRAFT_131436 [Colletotrichum navitas]|uniref:Uncharacterized protein n=1 Tax=Colletotrichum navitas TaxID=681940 RepID=A0AAD8Q3G4_9PEZI|nr:uncharacterized protein LY79DRAFT_131436 [Colletotrichum navitas]KAK1594521.1 hypothetical protein LY79DRAFT_131436 [Colletotrichum navitas]